MHLYSSSLKHLLYVCCTIFSVISTEELKGTCQVETIEIFFLLFCVIKLCGYCSVCKKDDVEISPDYNQDL